ncbi:hypothetical protein ANCCAN_10639 [Ancylostoma caninum]|uniref:Uncharacterized protein n=1 Tax=Ancylostoma caninum TaxID=29170 RepID=A0A368GK54_ANCCA|nr:hypothetical protein ANCCAN_10639 [Ancylostoma caninum]
MRISFTNPALFFLLAALHDVSGFSVDKATNRTGSLPVNENAVDIPEKEERQSVANEDIERESSGDGAQNEPNDRAAKPSGEQSTDDHSDDVELSSTNSTLTPLPDEQKEPPSSEEKGNPPQSNPNGTNSSDNGESSAISDLLPLNTSHPNANEAAGNNSGTAKPNGLEDDENSSLTSTLAVISICLSFFLHL